MLENKTFIAILGGTFNPIHNGHLAIANSLYEQLMVSTFYFLPCGYPVHKPQPLTAVEHRLAMLRLALAENPHYQIDEREIHKTQKNYTTISLSAIRKEHDEPLAFIVGSDAFCQLETWYQWQQLFELAHLIIIPRPNVNLPTHGALAKQLKERLIHQAEVLLQQTHGGIFIHAMPLLDISSTLICQRKQQGLDIRHLLPRAVYDYIQQHNLYSE